MKFVLPYDKKQIAVEIADRKFAGSLVSKVESYRPGQSQQELVETSLNHPIGSPSLEELARGKKNIVIISSDHTRPVPSKIITPILLRRIREAQPDANIKAGYSSIGLVATRARLRFAGTLRLPRTSHVATQTRNVLLCREAELSTLP